jgi:hypothetical protein
MMNDGKLRNEISSQRVSRYWIALGATAGFFALTNLAFAEALTDEDYAYLATVQHVGRSAPILNVSPKEKSSLHYLINDPAATNDPATRDKNVKSALDVFLAHQLWEKSHPGQLWDMPKRP